MKYVIALLMTISLAGCLGSGGGGSSKSWSMDPRLEAIALWAHNGATTVANLDADIYVPPVRGVNGPWGSTNRTVGTYFYGKSWKGSRIQVDINRSERHVQDIIAHEMGHYVDHYLNDKVSGEDYANYVNTEIRRLEADGLIPPAPSIDWDAVAPSRSPKPTSKYRAPTDGSQKK
jgi:hypothetical protein